MMKSKIEKLEKKARVLEPGGQTRKQLNKKVLAYANRFLSTLSSKKAYDLSDQNGAKLLEEPFSEDPDSIDHLLDLLENQVDTPGLNPASGGHIGYIPGGGIYPAALGDYLAAVANRYAGVFFSSPGAVRMENMCLRWLSNLVGYPETSSGNLTSGGSIANLIALVTARDAAGLHSRDYEKAVIYTTRQVHHCAIKAIKFAGLNDAVVRSVSMDEKYRMDPTSLENHIKNDRLEGLIPFMIFSSAGTTDVGAVDPLYSLADIAEQYELWFHVDAAYGGAFLLTEHGKRIMKGIDRADSVIIDPHKGLFLPYGSGALLVKEGKDLYDSQHMTANYLQDTLKANEERSPADLSPELSKHFRGLRMWLPLKLFGIRPFRAALEEKMCLTRYFYREVGKLEGIETGPEPELSVMYFRYVPESGDANAFNRELIGKIHRDGRIFLSSTTIDGTFYIRLAVLNFRTHIDQIDLTLELVSRFIREIDSDG